MQRIRRSPKILVALATIAVVAAACGSSKSPTTTATSAPAGAKHGGTLIVGAEQEPDCMDWMGSCSGSSWGYWIGNVTTIPKVYQVDQNNNYVLGNVMASPPQMTPGPPEKVTYHLNPKAKWSDGQPITSASFKYVWDQAAHGTDIYSTVGYSQIQSVDTPDPETAVVTFSKPYADWRDLFGADNYGLLPSHILQGKDRDALMKDGYTWSGGPWMIQSWVKGQNVTLVPNTNYWGQKPYLDKIVFQFITDTASEAQAYKTGQVNMIYPQPQVTLGDQVKNLPNSNFKVYQGLNFEGLWMNVAQPPLNDLAVRKALAYATDRQTIVQQLFGPIDPTIQPLQSTTPPGLKSVYVPAFDKYKLDLNQVDSIMKGDGWAKGADGIWAKGGQKADLTIKSTAGNARRELMEQVLQSEWKTAGFNLTISNEKAGTLFGQDLPHGNFQIGIYAQVPTSPDPGLCVLWCSQNIPNAANQYSGNNYTRINDPSLDNSWGKADTELNDSTRASLVKQGQQAVANLVPFIPVDPLPNVVVYNTKLKGPIGDNACEGPWWNANYWYMS